MEKIIIAGLAALFITTIFYSNYKAPKTPKNYKAEQLQVIKHIVKKGETLTEIANKYYKNPEYWTNLWNDNQHIINPSNLETGLQVNVKNVKPQSVEEIEANLMVRLLNNPDIQDPNPKLAFVGAGTAHTESKTNKAVITTIAPTIAVSPKTTPIYHYNQVSAYDEIYKQAGEEYGIPWQILYGLHLTETGQRDGAIFNSQGSGAQGPMQFMSGTWKAYGVDGNGDGTADINNAADAIHGAANYLVKHGGVLQGLYYYGGNTPGVLQAACEKGYCL